MPSQQDPTSIILLINTYCQELVAQLTSSPLHNYQIYTIKNYIKKKKKKKKKPTQQQHIDTDSNEDPKLLKTQFFVIYNLKGKIQIYLYNEKAKQLGFRERERETLAKQK